MLDYVERVGTRIGCVVFTIPAHWNCLVILSFSQFLECGPEEEDKIDVKSSNTITRRFPSHTVTHFQKQTLDLPTKDEEMLYTTQAAR